MVSTTSSPSPTVGILYGFSEGSLTGRRLRNALRRAGYVIARPRVADIIIAHSGGYLLLPRQFRTRLVVCIDPNTWGDRSLAASLREKLRYGNNQRKAKKQLATWLLQGLRNDLYILKVLHTYRLLRRYHAQPPPRATPARCVIIRNRHNSYSTPSALLGWANIGTYVSLPGGHDDVWNNPEHYAGIIGAIYES